MLDKIWWFNIGGKSIRVALPTNTLGRFFTFAMLAIFAYDMLHGNVVGMVLMGLFIAMNTVQMK